MKAVMSDRIKNWLKQDETTKQLIVAVNKLHVNGNKPTIVEIDGVKYKIKVAR